MFGSIGYENGKHFRGHLIARFHQSTHDVPTFLEAVKSHKKWMIEGYPNFRNPHSPILETNLDPSDVLCPVAVDGFKVDKGTQRQAATCHEKRASLQKRANKFERFLVVCPHRYTNTSIYINIYIYNVSVYIYIYIHMFTCITLYVTLYTWYNYSISLRGFWWFLCISDCRIYGGYSKVQTLNPLGVWLWCWW